MNDNEKLAFLFTQAIKTLAANRQNLENLENYLSYHFPEWMQKFANTPEKITAELIAFASMDFSGEE